MFFSRSSCTVLHTCQETRFDLIDCHCDCLIYRKYQSNKLIQYVSVVVLTVFNGSWSYQRKGYCMHTGNIKFSLNCVNMLFILWKCAQLETKLWPTSLEQRFYSETLIERKTINLRGYHVSFKYVLTYSNVAIPIEI